MMLAYAYRISFGIFSRNHTNRYTSNDVLEAVIVADVYMRCLHLNLQVKDVVSQRLRLSFQTANV